MANVFNRAVAAAVKKTLSDVEGSKLPPRKHLVWASLLYPGEMIHDLRDPKAVWRVDHRSSSGWTLRLVEYDGAPLEADGFLEDTERVMLLK